MRLRHAYRRARRPSGRIGARRSCGHVRDDHPAVSTCETIIRTRSGHAYRRADDTVLIIRPSLVRDASCHAHRRSASFDRDRTLSCVSHRPTTGPAFRVERTARPSLDHNGLAEVSAAEVSAPTVHCTVGAQFYARTSTVHQRDNCTAVELIPRG